MDTNDIRQVVRVQTAIIGEYRWDASKYDRANKLRIVRALEIIPSELNRENKRFYLTDLKAREKFERLEDHFVWLDRAGVAIPVYNVDAPASPLELAKKANLFKLFLNDVGLLACQYAEGIQMAILAGGIDANFGAVFENFVAQELRALPERRSRDSRPKPARAPCDAARRSMGNPKTFSRPSCFSSFSRFKPPPQNHNAPDGKLQQARSKMSHNKPHRKGLLHPTPIP